MGLEVELAEERQYCAKLAERVQQQARELQTKHAEVKELVEYKVLCERRILELQPKHQLPVVREQLGLDEPRQPEEAGGASRPLVDGMPTHMLSTLAQRRREYEDLSARYRSLEANSKRTHEKLGEANRALRDLRGAMESREKDHQAAQRKIEALSKNLAVVERHSKANEDYVNKMQRKFATGSQGTHLLRKNAILQKRLEEADAEKAQLALALQNESEEETNRQEYIAHLRKALDMKASDFGLKPGQSDVLQELQKLRASYRGSLQEVASYEDRCNAQDQTIGTLREQVEDLRREESTLQGQLNEALSRSRSVASELGDAQAELQSVGMRAETLSREKLELISSVEANVQKRTAAERDLQECQQRLQVSEHQAAALEQVTAGRDALRSEVERLKGSLAPLEAEVMGRRLEVDELSQHLQAKTDEVAEATAIQSELLEAARDAKNERQQLLSEQSEMTQARAKLTQTIAATQGELEESASQLRARDEQVAELKAEASRLRKRVDAKSAELESRTSVAAYIDGKFKAIADIVHRHPDCNIGAATQDVCKRVLMLEQEVQTLATVLASSGEPDDATMEAGAKRQHKIASGLESLVASCGALSRQSTQLIADADDEKQAVAADAQRRIQEAEATAREASEEAGAQVREAESRARALQEEVSALLSLQTALFIVGHPQDGSSFAAGCGSSRGRVVAARCVVVARGAEPRTRGRGGTAEARGGVQQLQVAFRKQGGTA